jgi:hypothetical protein
MTRYTKADIRNDVWQLEREAHAAGLLPEDHKLIYNAGSTTNGISATVMVQVPGGNYVHGFDRFIPEFTYKTTSTMQHRLLTAAINVFYAFRLQRDSK